MCHFGRDFGGHLSFGGLPPCEPSVMQMAARQEPSSPLLLDVSLGNPNRTQTDEAHAGKGDKLLGGCGNSKHAIALGRQIIFSTTASASLPEIPSRVPGEEVLGPRSVREAYSSTVWS